MLDDGLSSWVIDVEFGSSLHKILFYCNNGESLGNKVKKLLLNSFPNLLIFGIFLQACLECWLDFVADDDNFLFMDFFVKIHIWGNYLILHSDNINIMMINITFAKLYNIINVEIAHDSHKERASCTFSLFNHNKGPSFIYCHP